jgi:hypothetical protein
MIYLIDPLSAKGPCPKLVPCIGYVACHPKIVPLYGIDT